VKNKMKKRKKEKTCKAAIEKKNKIKKLKELAAKYPIIGILNLKNLPCAQLQKMRSKLKKDVEIFMARKTIMKLGLKETKLKEIEKLNEHIIGVPALIFTKENPFKIYNIIKKNKSPAPAKAGQKSPRDIIVPAGPTSFAPGPIISEFAAVGIIAGVEGGKVAIKKEAKLVKEGAEINEKTAGIMTKLNILPMEIGLDLTAVYEKGTIYDKKVLDIDEEQFKGDITKAAKQAFNLSIEAGIFTKETITQLITKAAANAKKVAEEAEIMTEETIPIIFAKAQAEASIIEEKIK
jgi:large subunit ribosomal protein L10